MPDFGFFSWPEPGVSSYIEVRQQTLDRERDIASGALVVHGHRQRELGNADEDTEDSAWESEKPTSPDQMVPNSWNKKIPKLIWRGVPMVAVRQVSQW